MIIFVWNWYIYDLSNCFRTLNNACLCLQVEDIDDTPTNTQDQTGLLIFRRDDPNHPLNNTRARKATLKLMKLTYIDDMPPSLQNEDDDANVVHEEGLNEMLTWFFRDGNNDEDPMVDNNDDIEEITTNIMLMILTLMTQSSK